MVTGGAGNALAKGVFIIHMLILITIYVLFAVLHFSPSLTEKVKKNIEITCIVFVSVSVVLNALLYYKIHSWGNKKIDFYE